MSYRNFDIENYENSKINSNNKINFDEDLFA